MLQSFSSTLSPATKTRARSRSRTLSRSRSYAGLDDFNPNRLSTISTDSKPALPKHKHKYHYLLSHDIRQVEFQRLIQREQEHAEQIELKLRLQLRTFVQHEREHERSVEKDRMRMLRDLEIQSAIQKEIEILDREKARERELFEAQLKKSQAMALKHRRREKTKEKGYVELKDTEEDQVTPTESRMRMRRVRSSPHLQLPTSSSNSSSSRHGYGQINSFRFPSSTASAPPVPPLPAHLTHLNVVNLNTPNANANANANAGSGSSSDSTHETSTSGSLLDTNANANTKLVKEKKSKSKLRGGLLDKIITSGNGESGSAGRGQNRLLSAPGNFKPLPAEPQSSILAGSPGSSSPYQQAQNQMLSPTSVSFASASASRSTEALGVATPRQRLSPPANSGFRLSGIFDKKEKDKDKDDKKAQAKQKQRKPTYEDIQQQRRIEALRSRGLLGTSASKAGARRNSAYEPGFNYNYSQGFMDDKSFNSNEDGSCEGRSGWEERKESVTDGLSAAEAIKREWMEKARADGGISGGSSERSAVKEGVFIDFNSGVEEEAESTSNKLDSQRDAKTMDHDQEVVEESEVSQILNVSIASVGDAGLVNGSRYLTLPGELVLPPRSMPMSPSLMSPVSEVPTASSATLTLVPDVSNPSNSDAAGGSAENMKKAIESSMQTSESVPSSSDSPKNANRKRASTVTTASASPSSPSKRKSHRVSTFVNLPPALAEAIQTTGTEDELISHNLRVPFPAENDAEDNREEDAHGMISIPSTPKTPLTPGIPQTPKSSHSKRSSTSRTSMLLTAISEDSSKSPTHNKWKHRLSKSFNDGPGSSGGFLGGESGVRYVPPAVAGAGDEEAIVGRPRAGSAPRAWRSPLIASSSTGSSLLARADDSVTSIPASASRRQSVAAVGIRENRSSSAANSTSKHRVSQGEGEDSEDNKPLGTGTGAGTTSMWIQRSPRERSSSRPDHPDDSVSKDTPQKSVSTESPGGRKRAATLSSPSSHYSSSAKASHEKPSDVFTGSGIRNVDIPQTTQSNAPSHAVPSPTPSPTSPTSGTSGSMSVPMPVTPVGLAFRINDPLTRVESSSGSSSSQNHSSISKQDNDREKLKVQFDPIETDRLSYSSDGLDLPPLPSKFGNSPNAIPQVITNDDMSKSLSPLISSSPVAPSFKPIEKRKSSLGLFGRRKTNAGDVVNGGGDAKLTSPQPSLSPPAQPPNLTKRSSLANLRRSVKSTLTLALSSSSDSSPRPPNAPFPTPSSPRMLSPTGSPVINSNTMQAVSIGGANGLRTRSSPVVTIHSRGSIMTQARGIEDAESRRLSEMAYLDM